jgi:hypothetical protein
MPLLLPLPGDQIRLFLTEEQIEHPLAPMEKVARHAKVPATSIPRSRSSAHDRQRRARLGERFDAPLGGQSVHFPFLDLSNDQLGFSKFGSQGVL